VVTVSTPLNVHAPGVDARTIRELAREAMRRACGSQKAAAFELDIEPAQLSRQLAGIERFPLEALAKSPRICEEFAFLLAQHLGHQPRSMNVQERRRQRLRMLKVQLLAVLDEELSESA
jgi:hypothetical protein